MSSKTVKIICKVGLALSLTALALARIYMLRNTGIMTYGFWEDQIGSILIAVFPLFMWATAKLLFSSKSKLPDHLKGFLPFAVYYFTAAIYIFLTINVLLTYSFGGMHISFEADLVSVIYMLITSLTVILAVSKQHYNGSGFSGKLYSVAGFIPLFIIFFFIQPRTIQILSSIIHTPASAVDTNGMYTNWFAYRINMLKLILASSPQSISSLKLQMFRLYNCPLAWFRLTMGWRSIPIAGIFITIMLLCSNKLCMCGSQDRVIFNRMLFTAIITQTLFGIIANMFLMYSSHIGIPALQNLYSLIIPLTLLFYSDKHTGTHE